MMKIRPVTREDAAELLAIYRPIVLETAISFEVEPPSLAEFETRIEKALAKYHWLVAEVDGRIAGYAYGTEHRTREAYRYAVETSAYVHPDFYRQGIGRSLYHQLLPALAHKGYCNAYAAIALPNKASIALHKSVGFQFIGIFPTIGWKFDQWHDVSWWHCPLRKNPA